MDPNTGLLEDALQQEDDVFNQGDVVELCCLDISRQIVKYETDMNIDGLNSDEDEAPVKDEVSIREGKTP